MAVSQEQFAKIARVSAMAVSKAVRSGRLRRAEGGIDPDDPLSREYLAHPSGQRRRPGGKKAGAKTKKKGSSPARRKSSVQVLGQNITVNLPADSEGEDWQDLGLQERIEKIRKLQIQNAILRGKYIERETVRRWVMSLYSIIASAFRSLSARIMPEIVAAIRSAENDAEALVAGAQVLDKHVYRSLMHIERMIVDFKDEVPELGEFKDGGNGGRS